MTDCYLSPHFKLSELTTSATARRLQIENEPSDFVVENLRYLCTHILEPARVILNEPIIITSGYRSPQLNAAVGGVHNSQHLVGEAADIKLPATQLSLIVLLASLASNNETDQLLLETAAQSSKWIHVSCAPRRTARGYINIFCQAR